MVGECRVIDKVRMGAVVSYSAFNGDSGGERYGATSASSITITEIVV